MSKIALIFPGQGSQKEGMGRDFYDAFLKSRKIFNKASDILGLDVCRLCFEKDERLNITKYTQVALLTFEWAVYNELINREIIPEVHAGLSLGEYSALIASGAIGFEEAIKLVWKRGTYMQEAVPTGIGTMVAIIGIEKDVVKRVCEETNRVVSIASYNSSNQFVISGSTEAVTEASKTLEQIGGKVTKLQVSGPFHSIMLKEASDKLKKYLEGVKISNTKSQYISNVTGDLVNDESQIKALLARQICEPVLWSNSIDTMRTVGVDTFIEVGPGKSLSSILKRDHRDIKVLNIGKVDELDNLHQLI